MENQMSKINIENFRVEEYLQQTNYDQIKLLELLNEKFHQKQILYRDFAVKKQALMQKMASLEKNAPKGLFATCSRLLHIGKAYRFNEELKKHKKDLKNTCLEVKKLEDEKKSLEETIESLKQSIKSSEFLKA